jgi:hypothetical protein
MQRTRGRETLRQAPPFGLCHGSRPRGSIGSPPERGAEAYVVWSGHVSAPEPRLTLSKAWEFFVPESGDLAVSGLHPAQGGSGACPRGPGTPVEVLDLTRRSGPYVQGSGTFPWGPDPLLISWSISSLLATWRPGSRPRGGVGRCLPRD